MSVSVNLMRSVDWSAIAAIYQEGIATGHATFQQVAPATWDEWSSGLVKECCLVARSEQRVLGWACLSPVSNRCVYRGIAEVSVYVAADARGCGVGNQLLSSLTEISERHGIWTLQAGIFPENIRSIRLHIANGFREVGRREKIGKMNFGPLAGMWRDVVLLERRSQIAGVD